MTDPIYSAALVREIAAERDATALNLDSTNKMSPHSEVAGVAAELMFACTYGLPMNRRPKGDADPGYDYVVNKHYIDCKASTNDKDSPEICLLITKGQVNTDNIYVMYYVNPDTLFAMPLGYEYGKIMAMRPVHDFKDGPAHWKLVTDLRSMWQLHRMLVEEEKDDGKD